MFAKCDRVIFLNIIAMLIMQKYIAMLIMQNLYIHIMFYEHLCDFDLQHVSG